MVEEKRSRREAEEKKRERGGFTLTDSLVFSRAFEEEFEYDVGSSQEFGRTGGFCAYRLC